MKSIALIVCMIFLWNPGGAQNPDAFYDSAEVNFNRGNYEMAAYFVQKAYEQIQIELQDSTKNYSTELNDLALIYQNMGVYEKALPLFLEALYNAERTLGKDHEYYAIYLGNLAGLYSIMGEYDKALPLYQEALENTEKNHGRNHAAYIIRLSNLAYLYSTTGDYDMALKLDTEAKESTERTLGKNHADYGIRLNNLAVLYITMGQYDKALPLCLEALENTKNYLGEDHPDYGIRLNNLAGLYEIMGQYDKALALYLEALEITGKTLGKNHADYGVRLFGLAGLYESMGEYDQALPLFQEALKNAERSFGKDHAVYGARLSGLAGLYESMGEYDQALPLYQEALENAEKTLGKNHAVYGIRLNDLAFLYKNTGRYDKALPLYLEAVENTGKTLGKNHAFYGACLNNLAGLLEITGDVRRAYPMYLEGIGLLMNQVENNFSFIGEKEKEMYSNENTDFRFNIYRSFAHRQSAEAHGFIQKLFDAELFNTGLILKGSRALQQSIGSAGNDSARRLYDHWMSLKSELARNYAKPIAERRADLTEVEEEANRLEGELTRMSSVFLQYRTEQRLRWTDIRNRLKPGEAAVQFSSFSYHDGKRWTDSTLYMALVLRSGDTTPHLVKLFEEKQLDSVLMKNGEDDELHVSSLYRGASLKNTGHQAEIRHGKDLYRLIWQPLESAIPGCSKIYFVPAGQLHQIAFSAIPAGDSSQLCNRYRLYQLSSLTHLLSEDEGTGPASIAIFGGIDYDAGENELKAGFTDTTLRQQFVSRSFTHELKRGVTWNYLPGTKDEAEAIEKMARTYHLALKSYDGANALEEHYKSMGTGSSPDIIHIATHGFFFPDPEKSMNNREQGDHIYNMSDNPLNRAGILFAGSNNTWQGRPAAGLEDGVLTAYEASNVPLRNTRLVTLSACETGLGDIKGSEGVYGLQRAFKMAGAQYLLMSLWKVPDKETAEFMELFYKHWFSGSPIREAFSSTQQQMSTRYPGEPYKWAAFVLVN